MPDSTKGASVRHSKATHSGGRVKRIEIEMHDAGGHTITHHYDQNEKGHYKEPTTEAYSHHGEVMEDVHDAMAKHGVDKGDSDCGMC